jgi:hypothetical protein
MSVQMIGELVRDPKIARLQLPSQTVRQQIDLGLARPVLDLQVLP